MRRKNAFFTFPKDSKFKRYPIDIIIQNNYKKMVKYLLIT